MPSVRVPGRWQRVLLLELRGPSGPFWGRAGPAAAKTEPRGLLGSRDRGFARASDGRRIWYAGRRISQAVHERLGPDGDAALGRVAKSLHTASRESHREKDFGCTLISADDASAIAGSRVTRTESDSDGCTYFGIPDPSLNPEADSVQELAGGANADPKVASAIRQMTGAMRANVESQDPGTRAGPGGERPLFSIHATAALSLSMETAKKVNGTALGGESVSGIGDDAFFVTMHRMFFVRRGTDYLMVQPLFVKDKRAVGIAAARKLLDSPRLRA